MEYKLLKSKPLRTGENKGKCVYYFMADDKSLPVVATRPLTSQEAAPLRELAKDQIKLQAWIRKLEGLV